MTAQFEKGQNQGVLSAESSAAHGDASATLSEHMSKFLFNPGDDKALRNLLKESTVSGGAVDNKTTLQDMQDESEAVRDLVRLNQLRHAETGQSRVVRLSDRLDTSSLAADTSKLLQQSADSKSPSEQKSLYESASILGAAGASSFIERARLGAIQLRMGDEGAAERTFSDALKINVPAVSLKFDNIRQLKDAVTDRHEELKVKRTLPELFKANVSWIDSSKDGRVDVSELNSAAGNTRDITASTLVKYLLKNYDNIDRGAKGIDQNDIAKYWQQMRSQQYQQSFQR